jgi:hypothetical protein
MSLTDSLSPSLSLLEKTVWTFKYTKDEDLVNENIEVIINFYDKVKYEININRYSSSFDIDLEKILEYPSTNKEELNKNAFSSCIL